MIGENMNFVLNSLMVIIAFSFFTVLGIFGVEMYEQHKAVDAGLQQCVVNSHVVWQKDCN
jgi:hypothetical protein